MLFVVDTINNFKMIKLNQSPFLSIKTQEYDLGCFSTQKVPCEIFYSIAPLTEKYKEHLLIE